MIVAQVSYRLNLLFLDLTGLVRNVDVYVARPSSEDLCISADAIEMHRSFQDDSKKGSDA
jgi:hypothetical protein